VRVIETCSAPTPGLAGTRCKNPRRERGSLRRSSRLQAIDTPRCRVIRCVLARVGPSSREEVLLTRDVARRGLPWRGSEAQGRLESDRSFGRLGTTDFHGEKSLGDGRGSAWLGSAVPFELTSGRLDAPRGSVLAVEGETFEGQIPRALPPETWRQGFGGS
jgi:hypothetical protein